MPDRKITELILSSGPYASGDIFPFVDGDDATQSVSGSTKGSVFGPFSSFLNLGEYTEDYFLSCGAFKVNSDGAISGQKIFTDGGNFSTDGNGTVYIGNSLTTSYLIVGSTTSLDSGNFTTNGNGDITLKSISSNTNVFGLTFDGHFNLDGNVSASGNLSLANGLIYSHDNGGSNPGSLYIAGLLHTSNASVSFDNATFYSDGNGNVTVANLSTGGITATSSVSFDSGSFTSDGIGSITVSYLTSNNDITASNYVYGGYLSITNSLSTDGGGITSDGTGALTVASLQSDSGNVETDGSGKITALKLYGRLIGKLDSNGVITSDVIANDNFIRCDSGGGSFSLRLPSSAISEGSTIFVIKDVGGYADSNPIGVYGESAELFDGYPSGVIATSGGVLRYFADGTNWWSW